VPLSGLNQLAASALHSQERARLFPSLNETSRIAPRFLQAMGLPKKRELSIKTERDFVSVVIPIRDEDSYLAEALQSVVQQTVPVGEILVVDDGSASEPARRIKNLCAEYRAEYIRMEPGCGVSRARNSAVSRARGEWIAFLDADDCWKARKIEFFLRRAQSMPDAVVVYSDAEFIDEQGNLRGRTVRSFWRIPELPSGHIRPYLLRASFILPSASLVSKKAFQRAGGFDEQLAIGEDWELWTRLSGIGDFAAVNQPLTRYRRHPRAECRLGIDRGPEYLRVIAVIYDRPGLPAELRRLRPQVEAWFLAREAANALIRGDAEHARSHACSAISRRSVTLLAYGVWLASFLPCNWIRALKQLAERN
jgi:Glycosyl transferase family 2